MKKYKLYENLNLALVEPDTNISAEAKKLGLKYVGFGRYENPNTGQVTHISKNGKLMPLQSVMKTNSYKRDNSDDIGSLSVLMSTKTEELYNILSKYYTPDLFSDSELDAIAAFTEDPFSVNNKISQMGVSASLDNVQPDFDGDTTYKTIIGMDSATKKIAVPIEFETYVSLGEGIDASQFKVGQKFRFNTFRSSSLDPSLVLNSGPIIPNQTKRTTFVLQIEVSEGTKGLFAEDFSSNPEEYEFIFARGTECEVIEAPNKIVGSSATFNINSHEIYYIACRT